MLTLSFMMLMYKSDWHIFPLWLNKFNKFNKYCVASWHLDNSLSKHVDRNMNRILRDYCYTHQCVIFEHFLMSI